MKNKDGQLSYIKTKLITALGGKSKKQVDNKDLKAKSVNKYGLRSKSVDKARKK